MKKYHSRIAFALLFLLLFFSVASAKEGAKEINKIDLKSTTDFMKSLDGRETFPDSVTFAYYYAYSLSALGEKIPATAEKKIVDFLKRCQTKNGGFTSEPANGAEPNIIFTYYAIKTLSFLGTLDAIDKEKATSYVLGLAQKDGGFFANDAQSGRATSLQMTFYGVQSLQMLKELKKLDAQKTIAFINGYTSKDGKGFSLLRKDDAGPMGSNVKEDAAPESTKMAVKALDVLGGLTDTTKTAVVAYLKSTRYSGLIKNKQYPTLPQLSEMADVLDTLSYLKAVNQVNTAKIYKFVESLYIGENGGFGPSPGLGTTPPSTFDGIVCLAKLGKIKDPEAKLQK